jgi:GrpB-like predicted nucleotidyltransferase (UPF0157 family)
VEYQSSWPLQFQAIRSELTTIFIADSTGIEHIGSTSVAQLCAKPVIDVMVGVKQLREVEQHIPALAELGFRYRPEHEVEIPERRYFVRQLHDQPRVHLHILVLGGLLWRRHLSFRNALREDTELKASYAELKRKLATQHCTDKQAYTAAKAPFILAALARIESNAEETAPACEAND